MEKIKSLLTGHHKEEHEAGHGTAHETAHETGHTPSSTTASTTASTTRPTGSPGRDESPGGSVRDTSDPRLAGSASGLTRDERMAGEGHTTGQPVGTGASSDTTHPLRGAAGTDYSSGNLPRPQPPQDFASNASIKSGVVGHSPESRVADLSALGGTAAAGTTGRGLTGESLPDRTAGTERSFPLSGGATAGQHTGTGAGLTGSTTSGPHSSDLANRVDPRGTTETTGTTGTTTGGLGSGHEGHGRDRVKEIVSMVYEHEHGGIGHQYRGDPCATDQPHEHAPGGPHQTVTANVLDPHVGGGELPALSTGDEPVPYASGPGGSGMSGTGTSSTGMSGAGVSGTGMTGSGTTAEQTGTGISGTGTTAGTTGDHHYGRDAGLAGAGAAAVGGLAEHERGHRAGPTAEDPASRTVGPHSSNVMNVLDPRVQPQPEKMKDHTTTGPHQSDMMNQMDPRVDSGSTQTGTGRDHHYGRDAALAGGATAAGVGAYEAGQQRGPQGISQTTPGYDSQRAPLQEHHHGRDAGIAGGAATTAGAYESEHRHRDPVTAGYDNLLSGREDPRTGLHHGDDSHRGRDAAAIGGAGAAGAGAAHEFTREDAERAQRHRMGVIEPEKKQHEKSGLFGLGHREKTSRSPSPRAAEREDKHREHGGLLGFGHKEKASRDPSPRATEREEKHHGGLLGFGHREKTSRDPSPGGTTTTTTTDPYADSHRGAETAVGAGAGLAGAGAAAEGVHHHNKLHKDPPPGYYNEQSTTGTSTGPIGGAGAGAMSGDSRLTGQGGTNQEGVVIEPHTGLPVNVAKYGTDGRGGLGENETAPGLQHVQAGQEDRANWEAIRKANTPY